MPKRYSPAQKQEALRLLDLHQYKASTVQHLTGISHSTLCRWRDEHFMNNPHLSGKKSSTIPNHHTRIKSPKPPHPDATLIQDGDFQYWRLPDGRVLADFTDEERERLKHLRGPDLPDAPAPDPPPAEPKAGIPGLSYPYPLEDDEPADNYGDFRKVRDILMKHAKYLAENLKPDEPDINRRSLALARIIDRVRQLDEMLPSLMPEQVIRHEFVYDGMVHNKPPWERTEEDLLAHLEIVREKKALETRKREEENASGN